MSRGVIEGGVLAVSLWFVAGCPPAKQDGTAGPKKDPVVGEGGTDPGSIKKGTWCCRACTSTAGVLTCSGCTSAPSTTTSCSTAGSTVLADCPGRTTFDGNNVVCY